MKPEAPHADPSRQPEPSGGGPTPRSRFAGYGEEMLEKTVRRSGSSGRVYLPQDWVGKTVKIIRLD